MMKEKELQKFFDKNIPKSQPKPKKKKFTKLESINEVVNIFIKSKIIILINFELM